MRGAVSVSLLVLSVFTNNVYSQQAVLPAAPSAAITPAVALYFLTASFYGYLIHLRACRA